jgi:hypothetical protein
MVTGVKEVYPALAKLTVVGLKVAPVETVTFPVKETSIRFVPAGTIWLMVDPVEEPESLITAVSLPAVKLNAVIFASVLAVFRVRFRV